MRVVAMATAPGKSHREGTGPMELCDMFSVELAARCIESVGGGPAPDPFMGSGTTAIAAESAGIDWIGMEKSRNCIQMANERLTRVAGRSS